MKYVFVAMLVLTTASFFIACNDQAATNIANMPTNTAAPANVANSNNPPNSAAIEADIKKLIADYAASTEKNDVAAYDKVTTDNFMFVGNDGTVQTKAERIATMRSGETKYELLRYDDVNVRVNPEGDGAVAIAKATVKGTNNGKPIDATVRVTQVWSKTKDGWNMASLQATNITAVSAPSKPDDKKDETNKAAADK